MNKKLRKSIRSIIILTILISMLLPKIAMAKNLDSIKLEDLNELNTEVEDKDTGQNKTKDKEEKKEKEKTELEKLEIVKGKAQGVNSKRVRINYKDIETKEIIKTKDIETLKSGEVILRLNEIEGYTLADKEIKKFNARGKNSIDIFYNKNPEIDFMANYKIRYVVEDKELGNLDIVKPEIGQTIKGSAFKLEAKEIPGYRIKNKEKDLVVNKDINQVIFKYEKSKLQSVNTNLSPSMIKPISGKNSNIENIKIKFIDVDKNEEENSLLELPLSKYVPDNTRDVEILPVGVIYDFFSEDNEVDKLGSLDVSKVDFSKYTLLTNRKLPITISKNMEDVKVELKESELGNERISYVIEHILIDDEKDIEDPSKHFEVKQRVGYAKVGDEILVEASEMDTLKDRYKKPEVMYIGDNLEKAEDLGFHKIKENFKENRIRLFYEKTEGSILDEIPEIDDTDYNDYWVSHTQKHRNYYTGKPIDEVNDIVGKYAEGTVVKLYPKRITGYEALDDYKQIKIEENKEGNTKDTIFRYIPKETEEIDDKASYVIRFFLKDENGAKTKAREDLYGEGIAGEILDHKQFKDLVDEEEYEFDKASPKRMVLKADEVNEMKIYFKSNDEIDETEPTPETEDTKVKATIKYNIYENLDAYLDKEDKERVVEEKRIFPKAGNYSILPSKSVDNVDLSKYTLLTKTPKKVEIKEKENEDENIIIFEYIKKVGEDQELPEGEEVYDYTIRHIYEEEIDGTKVEFDIVDRVVGSVKKNSIITVKPLDLKGFKPQEEGPKKIRINEKNKIIKIKYDKDEDKEDGTDPEDIEHKYEDYSIKYKEINKDNKLYKYENKALVGTIIEHSAPESVKKEEKDYKLFDSSTKSLEVNDDKENKLVFNYIKDGEHVIDPEEGEDQSKYVYYTVRHVRERSTGEYFDIQPAGVYKGRVGDLIEVSALVDDLTGEVGNNPAYKLAEGQSLIQEKVLDDEKMTEFIFKYEFVENDKDDKDDKEIDKNDQKGNVDVTYTVDHFDLVKNKEIKKSDHKVQVQDGSTIKILELPLEDYLKVTKMPIEIKVQDDGDGKFFEELTVHHFQGEGAISENGLIVQYRKRYVTEKKDSEDKSYYVDLKERSAGEAIKGQITSTDNPQSISINNVDDNKIEYSRIEDNKNNVRINKNNQDIVIKYKPEDNSKTIKAYNTEPKINIEHIFDDSVEVETMNIDMNIDESKKYSIEAREKEAYNQVEVSRLYTDDGMEISDNDRKVELNVNDKNDYYAIQFKYRNSEEPEGSEEKPETSEEVEYSIGFITEDGEEILEKETRTGKVGDKIAGKDLFKEFDSKIDKSKYKPLKSDPRKLILTKDGENNINLKYAILETEEGPEEENELPNIPDLPEKDKEDGKDKESEKDKEENEIGSGSSLPELEDPNYHLPETVKEILEEKLFKGDIKFIDGFEDGTIRGNDYTTREEVATIIFRILNEEYRNSIYTKDHNFPDVEKDRWSEEYIATLSNVELVNGYPDGNYKPANNMTRAEVVTILARLVNIEETTEENKFTDVKGHWAEEHINSLSSYKWIEGYESGEFRPDAQIKRSELVTVVNRVLGKNDFNATRTDRTFTDLNEDQWYYDNMSISIMDK